MSVRCFLLTLNVHLLQGMEDCVVLNELMDQYDDDLPKVLPAYSKYRNPDAEAIVDLAMYNYVEVSLIILTFFL